MSDHHVEADVQAEQRSRVKVTRNAKGDPQWELSIVEGADEDEVNRLRRIAVAQYNALLSELNARTV